MLQRRPLWLAWGIIGFGALLSTAGAPLIRWKPEFRLFYLPFYDQLASLPKLTSETIHANLLAGVLVVALPLAISLLMASEQRGVNWRNSSGMLIVLIMSLVFVLTQSRGGYLGLLIALVVLGVLRWSKSIWGGALLIIGIILLDSHFSAQAFLDILTGGDSFGGWSDRLDIWTQSARALQDFVFTGIGIGTFTLVIPLLYPLRVPIEGFPHAHNLFLQIGLDLGLPGLIAYLSIIISCFLMLVPLLRDRSDHLRWSLSIGATSSLVAMLVHGIFDAVLWGTKVAFVSWLLFALITVLHIQFVDEKME